MTTLSLANRRRIKRGVTFLSLAFFIVLVLFPLYWIVLTSLRSQSAIYIRTEMLTPRNLTIENYVDIFTKRPLLRWLGNSGLVAGVSTAVSMVIAVSAAYSLARLKYRGAESLAKTVLFMYLLPQALLYIPLYVMLSRFGFLNKLLALFVAYPTFVLPFCTWMLLGYFRTIPEELEDAARIDGCTRLEVLWRVVLPLAKPSIVTAAIFSLTAAWNEFLYAFVFISSENLKTIQVGVASLKIGDTILWGMMMAGAVICTIPPVIIYMLMQRYVVEGLTAGAVKG